MTCDTDFCKSSWLLLKQAKKPVEEHIPRVQGHCVNHLRFLRPALGPLPRIPSLVLLSSRLRTRRAKTEEDPASGGCGTSRRSCSRGLSRTRERSRLRTGGVLRGEGIPQPGYHLCKESRNSGGKILSVPAWPSTLRPAPPPAAAESNSYKRRTRLGLGESQGPSVNSH